MILENTKQSFMSNDIRIRKGAQLKLRGQAEKILNVAQPSATYALQPDDFFTTTPKLAVREGDQVAQGTPIFFDKKDPRIQFVSPVSGTVQAVVRGAKRKIFKVVIIAEGERQEKHDASPENRNSRDQIVSLMLAAGCWPFIKQRPYDVVANPDDTPNAILISTYATAPLDVDYEFLLKNNKSEFQAGIDILSKLTQGPLYLTYDNSFGGFFTGIQNVQGISVKGPHPAGNPSVQIQRLCPINSGDRVWVVGPEDVVNIGRFFETGVFSAQRTVAFAGTSVAAPQYFQTQIGAEIAPLMKVAQADTDRPVRIINGNVLTGVATDHEGHIGFYNNLVSIIPEGNHYRMFGWLPFVGNNIPSLSNTSLSWLFGKRGFEVDTNLNGEERALVVTGEMEKVFPMDIYPMQLLKACMIEDIEKMEALGIYEVVSEDFGLIDYANTSKIEAQEIIRQGIELMIKEVG